MDGAAAQGSSLGPQQRVSLLLPAFSYENAANRMPTDINEHVLLFKGLLSTYC